jgi:hypothetical protein
MTMLHADTRNRVLEIFTETAKNEKDEAIRAIASFLSEELMRITS